MDIEALCIWTPLTSHLCLPASRAGLKGILREMDVPFFDPLLIIKKTNGRMAGDHQWVQMIRNTAA